MSRRSTKTALGSLMAMTFLAAPIACQDQPNPYAMQDESWIMIDGTVEAVMPDAFTLDYGDGLITVEMDDGDRDADAYALMREDKVTVTGQIDDDFLETSTIEASSVYVENLGTTFYASARDEEDTRPIAVMGPISVSRAVIEGTVTNVQDDAFTLSTGLSEIEVEVDEMAYDPLDDQGYQKIEIGDEVQVTGSIDFDLFEGRVLDARSIITLMNG